MDRDQPPQARQGQTRTAGQRRNTQAMVPLRTRIRDLSQQSQSHCVLRSIVSTVHRPHRVCDAGLGAVRRPRSRVPDHRWAVGVPLRSHSWATLIVAVAKGTSHNPAPHHRRCAHKCSSSALPQRCTGNLRMIELEPAFPRRKHDHVGQRGEPVARPDWYLPTKASRSRP